MSVTEQQRHQLFTWMEEAMGSERAAVMMDLLPPVGWADVATKHDLFELEQRLDLRARALDERIEGTVARSAQAQTRTFVTWMLGLHGVLLAAVATATGLVIAFA